VNLTLYGVSRNFYVNPAVVTEYGLLLFLYLKLYSVAFIVPINIDRCWLLVVRT
jgi:hypothetical protein